MSWDHYFTLRYDGRVDDLYVADHEKICVGVATAVFDEAVMAVMLEPEAWVVPGGVGEPKELAHLAMLTATLVAFEMRLFDHEPHGVFLIHEDRILTRAEVSERVSTWGDHDRALARKMYLTNRPPRHLAVQRNHHE